MKKLNKFAMCALILPVGAFAAGAVTPDSHQQGSGAAQSQHGSGSQHSQPGSTTYGTEKSDQDYSAAERRAAADKQHGMAGMSKKAEFMSTTPNDAVRVDQVIGSKLHSRSSDTAAAGTTTRRSSDNDKEIGTIDDLIIDEEGQVVAVVVSVGGMLGMGKSSVAISWNAIDRTMNEDRDGYRFSVNATEEELNNAPSYDKDSDGIRARSSASN
ncbi:MAG: PRC-barrel domain-containing protein [Gammaproteobacteria bacterium]|nr:PRC-barrel domain-containing protein [Gammaproteobacteria bacterium]